jgi:ubiquinone/menaquinone biosynthesis C-methylase UbiE
MEEVRHRDGDHDWHSTQYVDEWIAKDATRDEKRKPMLAKMMAMAPFKADAAIRILDVAGGYGAVSEAALKVFPKARVTIQDYSDVMLERAREHFRGKPGPIAYVQGDLTDPNWVKSVGGPFDIAVSGIAIHNLEDMKLIADCYRAIHGLLVPGGVFLNCDHFGRAEGVEANLDALKKAGFEKVACPWQERMTGISTATRKAA